MKLLFSYEAWVRVPDVRGAASHARTEISACYSQNENHASGHIFAPVLAYALDYRCCTRVTNGESFPGAAGGKQEARSCSVEAYIAHNDLRLGGCCQHSARTQNDFAAGKTFADIIVGLTLQDERHAVGGEGTKRLPRRTSHLNADVWFRRNLATPQQCQLAGQPRSQASVFVSYVQTAFEVLARQSGGNCRLYPCLVDRIMIFRTYVALTFPMERAISR